MATAAAKGSVLNSGQWFVNKVATAGAMLVIARLLSPDEYGVASQSLAIAQFLVVLTPLTVGDVLIAHPRHFAVLVPSARVVALACGASMGLLVLAAIPVATAVYSKYPASWLAAMLAVLALRPLLEGLLVVPVSKLRLALSYRRLAVTDGLVQLAMTVTGLVMAMIGARSASLVAPQVLGTGIRAVLYRQDAPQARGARFHRIAARALVAGLIPASLAQYVHNVVVLLEVLVLGYLTTDSETGIFGFAFTLAAQANGVIAYQLGVVLQPIFGRLQPDVERQVSAFARAQMVLASVCIPLSLVQAMLAEPLFRLVFDAKWAPALPVFQAISFGQAFYFSTGPSIACLRAQRRFGTLFAWQGCQALCCVPLYAFGASRGGAFGVAIASGAAWAISGPVGVMLCGTVGRTAGTWTAVRIFLIPLLASIIPVTTGWFMVLWLSGLGAVGDVASLAIVGPVVLMGAAAIALSADPGSREIVFPRVMAVVSRLRRAFNE